MTLPEAILVDDGRGELAPLTDLRPAFDVRTGAMTLYERVRAVLGLNVVGVFVPEALAGVTQEAYPDVAVNTMPGGDAFVVIHARSVTPVAGDRLDRESARGRVEAMLSGEHDAGAVLSRPWDVIRTRDAAIAGDLAWLARRTDEEAIGDGVVVMGEDPIRLFRGASVCPGVVLDARNGPIVLDERASVRAGAIIVGPAYVGPDSMVLERALIKANTAIGPWCKVAGEVAGTIFQGHANKAHEGHLGDSWVGQWVNLGAGTTNSNLLNTYGPVVAQGELGGRRERTGLTFLGAIIGDHARTAILTRIMTGAVIGTGVMWAAGDPVSGCVGSFTWATDSGRRAYRLEKFVEVARRVMARRGVEPGRAYLQRIAAVHAARPPGEPS